MTAPILSERERIEKAREYVIEGYATMGHVVPSIAGLAGYFGVGRPRIRAWCEQDEDFAEIVEGMLAVQETMLLAGGLSRSMDPTIVKLALSKHGYSTTATIEHAGIPKIPNQLVLSVDPQQAAEVYARLMRGEDAATSAV